MVTKAGPVDLGSRVKRRLRKTVRSITGERIKKNPILQSATSLPPPLASQYRASRYGPLTNGFGRRTRPRPDGRSRRRSHCTRSVQRPVAGSRSLGADRARARAPRRAETGLDKVRLRVHGERVSFISVSETAVSVGARRRRV